MKRNIVPVMLFIVGGYLLYNAHKYYGVTWIDLNKHNLYPIFPFSAGVVVILIAIKWIKHNNRLKKK